MVCLNKRLRVGINKLNPYILPIKLRDSLRDLLELIQNKGCININYED